MPLKTPALPRNETRQHTTFERLIRGWVYSTPQNRLKDDIYRLRYRGWIIEDQRRSGGWKRYRMADARKITYARMTATKKR